MSEKRNVSLKARWQMFKTKLALDPLTKKRLERFSEIKRAKISLMIVFGFYIFALLGELFISNKPLVMKVDGKFYFPTYGKVRLAQDFGFRVGTELELNYREFEKHLKETKRGWMFLPVVPYNPFEADLAQAPLSMTFKGTPILGISINSKDDFPGDNPKMYTWVDLATLGGIKMPDGTYTWIKYGDAKVPKHELSDFPSKERSWIGVAIGQQSSNESSKPEKYIWHKVGSDNNTIELPDGQVLTFRYAKGDKGQMFHPLAPNFKNRHFLGTDRIGRDILARLVYGFRIAMSFSLLVTFATYFIGVIFGICMGYFGGVFDTISQRLIEIWERIPYLYMIMILAAIFKPNFIMFVLINIFFGWTGATWSMRAMTYRERERDYILAAKSMGASVWRIITVHILPNIIVILVTSLPFAISGGIGSLTALDYLGYGLQPPTPSWGELLSIGTGTYQEAPWILSSIVTCSVLVLIMVTFIGEGLRDAFDPKRFTIYK